MATKPYIKLTSTDSGDWYILEMNCGEDFRVEGHRISNNDWIELLKILGYKVEREEISEDEMLEK